MRLFEAIVEANFMAPGLQAAVTLPEEVAGSLPVAALTCIDSRLNRLIPRRLGIPEDQLVWLRNAGNIVSGPESSTMRSLVLACAVKGAKELAVIGHHDCRVAHSTVLELTQRLDAMGVERDRLPGDLVDYFRLFASERQNGIQAVETVRRSPIMGWKIPVHGLLLNVTDGRLEWVVNGYHTLPEASVTVVAGPANPQAVGENTVAALPDLGRIDEPRLTPTNDFMLPPAQIGDFGPSGQATEEIGARSTTALPAEPQVPQREPSPTEVVPALGKMLTRGLEHARRELSPATLFDKARRYKVIGSDHKVYGPIPGVKILQWIAEDRIGWDTPAQVEGSAEW